MQPDGRNTLIILPEFRPNKHLLNVNQLPGKKSPDKDRNNTHTHKQTIMAWYLDRTFNLFHVMLCSCHGHVRLLILEFTILNCRYNTLEGKPVKSQNTNYSFTCVCWVGEWWVGVSWVWIVSIGYCLNSSRTSGLSKEGCGFDSRPFVSLNKLMVGSEQQFLKIWYNTWEWKSSSMIKSLCCIPCTADKEICQTLPPNPIVNLCKYIFTQTHVSEATGGSFRFLYWNLLGNLNAV